MSTETKRLIQGWIFYLSLASLLLIFMHSTKQRVDALDVQLQQCREVKRLP